MSDDWDKLSDKQKEDLDSVRRLVHKFLEEERISFEKKHIDVRLSYSIVIDPYIGKPNIKEL